MGTRTWLGFLAVAGLVAIAIIWRATFAPHEEGDVVRANPVPVSGPTGLQAAVVETPGEARSEGRVPAEPAQPGRPEADEAAATLTSSVRVHFVDEQGASLAGVELRVAEFSAPVVLSEPDGIARLELGAALFTGATRTCSFESRCKGFARDRRSALVTAGEELLLGDWMLVPGGAVEGIVVDESGRGLAGAEVGCLRADLEEGRWERVRRGALEWLWRPAARAETARDGAFVLEDVPAGRIRLVAVTDDRPAGRSDPVDVPSGGRARGVQIRMEASDGGTSIAGTVLDPAGVAVAGAPVKISGGGSSHEFAADEYGRFQVRLEDRKARDVTAFDPERRYREATRLGVTPGTKGLVLQLASAPEIELTVKTRDGAPIERFAVATIAERDAEVLAFLPEEERPAGLLVLGSPGQSFRIEVRANGWMPARLGPFPPEAPPARLECRLDPAGGIRGVVLADGKPLAGATVGLYAAIEKNDTYNGFPLRMQTSPVIECESEGQGVFSLSVEEVGTYYLRGEAEGHAPGELGPLELSPTGQREERLELGPGGTIAARVRSSRGKSVTGLLVAISRGDGKARTERTDESGQVVFPRLTPGKWQVALSEEEIDPRYGATRFGTKAAREIPTNCRVFAGETTRVDLWLEDEDGGDCRLEGRLVIDGKPAEGWLAGLTEGRAKLAEAQALTEPGSFRLSVDEPGSYSLSLRPDSADPSAMLAIFDPVELYEGTSFWSLELETGVLEGTLGAASGEHSLVFYRWQRGALQCFAPLVPGEDGRFRCALAPAGRGALVRCDPSRPLEEQTPIVLRELTVEAGKTLSIEL